jgi:uncharacterized BrkB/YihY/UPF0761 family membrane protein
MVEQTKEQGRRPIWYLVGWMLTVVGLLIVIAGIISLFTTLPSTSIVKRTHPDLWWGGFITLVGLFYIWKHSGVKVE